jgi:hypothetical protein
MRSTNEVIDNHLKCFSEGDLAGILADFAPTAVLFTPDGPLQGRAIDALFEALIAEFGKPGSTFALRQRSVAREVGYIVWTAETADNRYELVTDTFIVREGRIAMQSFAAKVVTKH